MNSMRRSSLLLCVAWAAAYLCMHSRTFGASLQWETASPASEGLSADRLDDLRDSLAARGTKALLVIRNDRIVCEWYAVGHGPAEQHYTASLAKALVGGMSLVLALNDGRIGVDDLACKYIPRWKDHPQKSKITIRHLATHSSGIEDAELSEEDRRKALAEGVTITANHMSLPGWKGAFWRKEPDPFTISRDSAPLIFAPGSRYAYSNPGMAMLAYAVTASLKDTDHSDIRTLLRERIMQPIGVADSQWSIGYGKTYDVDGLKLIANWGGGSFTARAVARVGRLMLCRGNWQGTPLIDSHWVEEVLRYAGTQLPGRPAGNPQPACGLAWYNNFDGVWPKVPRDAFAGAGAGNQVLLVVPSLGLIVVRSGADLYDPARGEGFWGGIERYLFNPVMAAFLDEPLLSGKKTEAKTQPKAIRSIIRVAQVKVYPEKGDVEANHAKLMGVLADIAKNHEVDVVVTPEGFLDGYVSTEKSVTKADMIKYAMDPVTSRYARAASDWAKRNKAWLIYGCTRKKGNAVFNTALIYDRSGSLVGMYDKLHLQTHDHKYTPGGHLNVYESDFGLFGVMICADRRWPETTRTLTCKGARVIFNPTYGMHGDLNLAMMRTRAYENGIFIVFTHPGQSLITGPNGAVVRNCRDKSEKYTVTEIDLSRALADKSGHILDRRPDVYDF